MKTKLDTWHIKELKQKNEELERMVAEKTADLIRKNRELEIEMCLERVRTIVLSMKEASDMLEVCRVISEQLDILSVTDIRNVQTAVINETKGTFLNYEYYGGYDKSFITEIDYQTHPTQTAFVTQMLTSSDAFFRKNFEGAELKKGLNHQIETDQFIDPHLEVLNSLNYYFHSMGPVALGVSTYSPLNNEDLIIFKRFRNVFELAYRRFIDIEIAMEQAKEAQIEAALERVRSKTMVMHNSNDVGETVATLFEEVLKLGLDTSIRCGIGILEGTEHMETWSATSYPNGEIDLKMGMLDMTVHPLLVGVKNSWKNEETGFTYELIGDDVIRYYDALNNEPEYPFNIELDTLPEKVIHNSFTFNEGILFSFTSNPLSEEAVKVLKRFASVFGQTYRRYLDLQTAEAQAREAQIEAAIERVRAKAMAMHKSEDLTSAVATVFDELVRLGFKTIRCGIGIFNDQSGKVNVWTTSSDDKSDSVHLSGDELLEGHPLLEGIFDAWQNQHDYSYVLEGKDLSDYYNITADSNFPVQAPKVNSENVIQYYHCVMFPAGGLFAFRESEFTIEAKQLMRRFADVFHLTFIRHLDLKNAEAQNKIIQAENKRKSQELEEARQLQLAMLPKTIPQLPNLDIAVYMQTATEVGGDYYDFHVEDDGTLTAVLGDATGHGLKAGTIVTITKSLFHSLASGKDILSSFTEISRVIKGMNFRQLLMCLQMLKIKGDQLSISSAAMPPVLIYRGKEKTVEEIPFEGMPLGAMNNFPYSLIESHLERGDTILMLSDGLPELMNGNKEMYGYDRIKTEFQSVGEKASEEIIDHLTNSTSDWVDGKDPNDDITFVVIKVQ